MTERGVASLMVTTVLILVIGLIIVGFSQVTRRNQRETLDRQLSTQAFYAAETAVNSVQAYIKSLPAGSSVTSKTNCGSSAPYNEAYNFPDGNASVTCLLVSGATGEMYYPKVNGTEPTIAPVIASEPISRIVLTWSRTDSTGTLSDCSSDSLTQAPNWTCTHGVLRADVVNTNPGSYASNISSPAMAVFLRPNTGSGSSSVGYSTGPVGSGGFVPIDNCTADRCQATITGLSSPQYTLRLLSLYKDSSVTIEAYNAGGTKLQLFGQVLVDATGKAANVLRRIQVRLPAAGQPASNVPLYGIETNDSICKRYVVAPGTPNGVFNVNMPSGLLIPATACDVL